MLPLICTETAVPSVSADFMQVVGAEVFLPESVTISISDDGANFTELKQYTFEVNRKEAIKFISISWEGSAEGRYIRYPARILLRKGGSLHVKIMLILFSLTIMISSGNLW